MHHMEQKMLFYLILMILSIGIHLKLLEKKIGSIGKRFHLNFLGCVHWFVSIRIFQMKDHSISVYEARYATSIVAKYLNTVTANKNESFYKTTLPYDMIFTKYDA